MKYQDRVYGEFEITEPVILDLINSKALQRLKGIDQSGYRALWARPEVEMGESDNSRFAHSVGVYILLWKYGASLAEQVAGLIHDVSHTAFSHCIDYVINIGNEDKQNHQDNVFESFVMKSEIPGILEKHGLDARYILNDDNFPLKENNLPDICADRIDYSLRTAVVFGDISFNKAQEILGNLFAENGVWFFRDFESAKAYAQLFLKINDVYYAGFESARMYEGVRGFVVYGLEKGYVNEEDLYTDDKFVIEKICKHVGDDVEVAKLFERLNNKSAITEVSSGGDREVICKSRIIDPLFLNADRLMRISEAESLWGDVVRENMKPRKYFLKYL